MPAYLARTFDLPLLIDTNTPRNVNFAYTQGMLTGVTSSATTYGTLSYHPNLLVSQVAHDNGVVETQGNDPNGIRRPSSLAATGPYALEVWNESELRCSTVKIRFPNKEGARPALK